jgi:hypothetical protein
MFSELVQDAVDAFSVVGQVVIGVYQYVVHVDGHPPFSEFFCEHVVHHRLEGCRGVCKAEEHYSRFKKSLVCDEGRLPFVALFDSHIVIPPPYIKF